MNFVTADMLFAVSEYKGLCPDNGKYVLLFLCQISYFTAVVLRCPFKISSTAIEDIYFASCSISALKSQYFS